MPHRSEIANGRSAARTGGKGGAYNRRLIEASLDPLVTIGPDGKITDVNAATESATGLKRTELIGTDFSSYFTNPEKAQAGYEQVFRDGFVRDYPLELRHRDGSITYVLYNASVYHDETGRVIGVFAAARDVTERRRAEAALEESERSFRFLAETVPQIVWATRADGWNTYFNQHWADYTGMSLEESHGHGWNIPFHPDDRQRAWEAWQQAVLHGAQYSLEARLRRADGVYRWWLVRGAPLTDSTGKVIKWFGTCTDIHDLKTAEDEIRQLNAQLEQWVGERTAELKERMAELQTVFDTAPIGLGITYELDCQHIRGNPPLERMLGIPAGAEISLEGPQPKPYRTFANGRELPTEELPIQRAARGLTVTGQLLDIRTADGRTIYLHSSAAPVLDETGKPRGAIGVFQDITELKEAEEALRQSELRFHTIYDTAPVSIWQEDWSGVIEAINRVRAEGVTDWPRYFREHPEFVLRALDNVKILDVNQWTLTMFAARDKAELLASLATVFATPDTLPGFVGELIALATGQPVYRAEMMLNTVKGDLIYGLLAMVLPAVGSGSTSVLVSVIDITDRKRAEFELQQVATELQTSNKELESFAYSVSHDLRTPLRSIDGFSHILLRDQAEALGEAGRRNLERIRAATQRMGTLIDDLLQLSRTARADFHRVSVDLAHLARAIATDLSTSAPSRHVVWNIAPELPAMADTSLIRVVLENLLSNAWKFTSQRETARIEFNVLSGSDERIFFVRDNGVGFDMAYAAKLFRAFERLHTPSQFAGSGIGLATVQRIIHRHGGRVWAEGKVDGGATFYFTLPAATPKR